MIGAVVLAAGEGRRFGGRKQLHPVDGVPMLERVLLAVAAGGVGERVVVLGAHAGDILAAVDLHGARAVVCEAWRDGQAASLHAGLGGAPAGGFGPGARRARRRAGARPCGRRADGRGPFGDARRSRPTTAPAARTPSWSRGRSGDEIPRHGETPVRPLGADLVDCRDLRAPGDVDYATSS